TTQVASGSVIGSGLGRRGSTVRWGTAGRIAIGLLLTLPAAAIVGALAALVAHLGTWGVIIDAVVGVGTVVFIFLRSRRAPIGHHNVVSEVAASGEAIAIAPKSEKKVAK